MDLGAPGYRTLLARYVSHDVRPQYDALFADDVFAATDTFTHVVAAPCGRSFNAERDATFGAWKAAAIPIVFNGFGLAPDDGRVSDQSRTWQQSFGRWPASSNSSASATR